MGAAVSSSDIKLRRCSLTWPHCAAVQQWLRRSKPPCSCKDGVCRINHLSPETYFGRDFVSLNQSDLCLTTQCHTFSIQMAFSDDMTWSCTALWPDDLLSKNKRWCSNGCVWITEDGLLENQHKKNPNILFETNVLSGKLAIGIIQRLLATFRTDRNDFSLGGVGSADGSCR